MNVQYPNIDAYLAEQTDVAIERLSAIRQIIQAAVPEAEEVISYGMPAFKSESVFAYFAAFKNHYSLFILPDTIAHHAEDLKAFKTSKGAINFPLKHEVSPELVTRLVQYSAQIKREKAAVKAQLKAELQAEIKARKKAAKETLS